MLTTTLPDKTTVQTLTPDPSVYGVFLVPLRLITSSRGCERQVLKVNAKLNETQKQVEQRVHAAFVESVCDLKNINFNYQAIEERPIIHNRR